MARTRTPKQAQSQQHENEIVAAQFGSGEFSVLQAMTAENLAAILTSASAGDFGELYKLYWNMERFNPDIVTGLQQRRSAPLTLSWQVYPYDSRRDENFFVQPGAAARRADRAIAKRMDTYLREHDVLDTLLPLLMVAVGQGVAPVEIADSEGNSGWRKMGDVWIPQFQLRPLTVCVPSKKNRNSIQFRTSTGAEDFWPLGWVNHESPAIPGASYESGLLFCLAWLYVFSQWTEADISKFLRDYGMPKYLGSYALGTSLEDQKKFRRALASMAKSAHGIAPDTMVVKVLDAVRGQSTAFLSWLEYNGKLTRRLITGSDTPFAERGGVFSGGDMRQTELWDLITADLRQLEKTLRNLLWMIGYLNFGLDDPAKTPRIYFDISLSEDDDKRLARDQILYSMGYRLSPEEVAARYGEGYVDIGVQAKQPALPAQENAAQDDTQPPEDAPVDDAEGEEPADAEPVDDPDLEQDQEDMADQ
jgi:phage gp29-like protein